MKLSFSKLFSKKFARLGPTEKKATSAKLQQLVEERTAYGMRLKQLTNSDYHSLRINDNFRVILLRNESGYAVVDIGNHDIEDRYG